MKLIGLTLGAFLFVAAPAFAQTNPCDIAQPTSGTGVAGQVLTGQMCSDLKDTNGNTTTITSGFLYDNGVKSPVTLTPSGTPSATSGKQLFTFPYTVPAAAGLHTLQSSLVNAQGESAKGNSFALTVSLAPSVPTAPTGLTAK